MFDPDEYRNEITTRLTEMAICHDTATAALQQLRRHLELRGSIPYPRDAIKQVLVEWINDVLEKVSAAYQGDSDATIDTGRRFPSHFLDVDCKDRNLSRLLRDDEVSLADVVPVFVSEYDFINFAKWLKSRAVELETEGFAAAADTIANAFGLNASHGRTRPPVVKAGRYQFEKLIYGDFSYGYSHSETNGLRQLSSAFRTMELTIGVTGASPSITAVAEAFSESRNGIASRTTFYKESKVAVTVFNGKIVFAIKPEIADATLAFLALHATVPLIGADGKRAA